MVVRAGLRPFAVLAAAALLAACGGVPLPPDAFVVGGDRPAIVLPPPEHDAARPTPLLVVLHGYAASAAQVERRFPLGSGAAVAEVILVRPQGTTDAVGRRFWNASEACCDLFGAGVDDAAYLLDLIAEIEERLTVSEIALFGHSNGGFMAYRLACDHPERFAAVVTVAGALDDPPPDCGDGGPARVLHIHGTADPIIDFEGGALPRRPPYTSAEATVAAFATGAGCGAFAAGAPFDLDAGIEGAETVPYEADCPEGRRVTLWRIEDGRHEPDVRESFAARVLRFAFEP